MFDGTTQTGLVTIYNTTTGNHLKVGPSGIDMSNSPRDFLVISLQIDNNQTWRIGPTGARNLTVGSSSTTASKLAGRENVTVTIPMAPHAKKFVRLKADIPFTP